MRKARRADIPSLVLHGEFFWDQSPYHKTMPYNPKAVKDLLEVMIDDHYLVVATHGEQIIGFIGIMIVPFHFNPDYTIGTEMFFFVHPRHRGVVGKQLINKAEKDLADKVDILSFGDMTTSTDMENYYVTRGYQMTERNYTKVL